MKLVVLTLLFVLVAGKKRAGRRWCVIATHGVGNANGRSHPAIAPSYLLLYLLLSPSITPFLKLLSFHIHMKESIPHSSLLSGGRYLEDKSEDHPNTEVKSVYAECSLNNKAKNEGSTAFLSSLRFTVKTKKKVQVVHIRDIYKCTMCPIELKKKFMNEITLFV